MMLNPESLAAVQRNLEDFGERGSVPLRVAQRLVSESAWWYGHPQGPARAPKHYERIRPGPHGWELEFGANCFLVEKAIARCKDRIVQAIGTALASGSRVDGTALRKDMALAVRASVANYNGEEYSGFYDASDGFMHFGTQAISVNAFVDELFRLAGLHRICE